MKTKFYKVLLCCLFAGSSAMAQVNKKPFVVPELQSWKGNKGELALKENFNIAYNDAELKDVAEMLADDFQDLFGITPNVVTRVNGKTQIVLDLDKIKTDNKEGYTIDISNRVVVKANEPIGALWATKSILQILEQNEGDKLPKGHIFDYPTYPVRGFMLDVGRKYFPIEFLRDYVKFMAYYKMNTFHVHLNDNAFKQFYNHDWMATPAAFRLESETYPGLASKEGHYTKKEFIDLQKLAESEGVDIIPEIDIPAHSLAFSQYLRELGSEEYGLDHLDLFNPKTYEFFDALFAEYLGGEEPVFRGKVVHIGTDEYSNKDPKVVEKFRYFTDHYIKVAQKYGKTAGIWGALTHAKGETPVEVENVIMDCWYNGYADPKDMIAKGYDVVSIPDGLVYIVPGAHYYYDYLNCEYLYNKWTPATIGNQTFEESHPQIKGGKFAVWNDHAGNGISTKDVHHRAWPAMQTIATKTWTASNVKTPFAEFNEKRELLSEAPGVNIKARISGKTGLILHKEKLVAGDQNKIKEIGYDYKVEFTIKAKGNNNGTKLFSSDNSTVYLRSLNSGKLSFERDGYHNEFNYIIPNDQAVLIRIEGDAEKTSLYVNNSHIETLGKRVVLYDQEGKEKKAYYSTLVFPLEKVENFKGEIKNLRVYQK